MDGEHVTLSQNNMHLNFRAFLKTSQYTGIELADMNESQKLVSLMTHRNVFLTHGTRISLSMAVCDFSVSACLSHPRIKLLSQTVNHC